MQHPSLTIRRLTTPPTGDIARHWCRNEPAMTHLLNAYTLLVPDNEGFYIRTLNACLPQLDGEHRLQRQVHEFVRQEGQHGVGHRKAWKVLEDQGYRFKRFVKTVAMLAYGPVEKFMPLSLRASMVTAIEHINAFMGHEFLAGDLLQGVEPKMRALFEWHFAEEVEHRSVAFDVMQKIWPAYGTRLAGAALTFPLFYLAMAAGAVNLMRQDGSLWKLSTWKQLWLHLGPRDRMLGRTFKHLTDYLKPSFHPSQMGDDALAARTLARWSQQLAEVPAARVPLATPALPPAEAEAAVAPLPASASAPIEFLPARIQGERARVRAPGVVGIANDQDFESLRIVHDGENAVHWVYMHPASARARANYRACFHKPLIEEILAWQKRLGMTLNHAGPNRDRLPHVVLASDSDVFNLGGDLDLFARLIRAQDRDGLLAYARACVEGVHAFHAGLGAGAHSIALVRGDALGGGFEAALSCHTIVAEAGSGMGLPEVLFDLFPGMGAFSFLQHRVGPRKAEEMMLSGDVYRAEDLHRLGVVDVLVARGEGEAAVMDIVRRNRRIPNARAAMHKVRNEVTPVTLDELMRVTEIWVDTALELGDKSLRTMERLVRAQVKRHGGSDDVAADTRAG